MKRLLPLLLCLLCLLFLLSACSAYPSTEQTQEPVTIVATTYPIYLFTQMLSIDATNTSLLQLVDQDISCLHDYTLTANEMRLLEEAEILVINGAGLDDFILDAIAGLPEDARPAVINCSEFIDLLPTEDGGVDPHYWMDFTLVARVLQGLSMQLSSLNPENVDAYRGETGNYMAMLMEAEEKYRTMLEPLRTRELITFHDGFAYFANAFDLTILMAVEEEEGQAASAQVISEALALIETHNLPAIFTEVYSADSTAQTVASESGVTIYPLSMVMGAEGRPFGVYTYLYVMDQNIATLLEALG